MSPKPSPFSSFANSLAGNPAGISGMEGEARQMDLEPHETDPLSTLLNKCVLLSQTAKEKFVGYEVLKNSQIQQLEATILEKSNDMDLMKSNFEKQLQDKDCVILSLRKKIKQQNSQRQTYIKKVQELDKFMKKLKETHYKVRKIENEFQDQFTYTMNGFQKYKNLVEETSQESQDLELGQNGEQMDGLENFYAGLNEEYYEGTDCSVNDMVEAILGLPQSGDSDSGSEIVVG